MTTTPKNDSSTFIFNTLFAGMGMLLLGVATWIGASVADIPAIKTELQNMRATLSAELSDHELRIRTLEHDQ